MKILAVILLFMLSACVTEAPAPGASPNFTIGDAVTPPSGYTDLCKRDPSLIECGGK